MRIIRAIAALALTALPASALAHDSGLDLVNDSVVSAVAQFKKDVVQAPHIFKSLKAGLAGPVVKVEFTTTEGKVVYDCVMNMDTPEMAIDCKAE